MHSEPPEHSASVCTRSPKMDSDDSSYYSEDSPRCDDLLDVLFYGHGEVFPHAWLSTAMIAMDRLGLTRELADEVADGLEFTEALA